MKTLMARTQTLKLIHIPYKETAIGCPLEALDLKC